VREEMTDLGFAILLSMFMCLDYHCYIRGNDSIFFKDKTKLEKDLREIQKMEIEMKLKDLKWELKNNP
jgi:hypothetical protein